MNEDGVLAIKPTNMTFEEAAVIPSGGITTLGIVRMAGIQSGQKVLIYGASGSVGSFAVQLAKYFGAEVTGVCSTRNVEIVRSIGADHAIDYTKEDFAESGQHYDLILDNVASRSFSDLRRVLTPQGVIVPNSGHGGMGYVIKGYLLAAFMHQQKAPFYAAPNDGDLIFIKELIEAGKVTPVIDKTYPLRETPEAFRYLEKEHAQGKVVINVTQNGH